MNDMRQRPAGNDRVRKDSKRLKLNEDGNTGDLFDL